MANKAVRLVADHFSRFPPQDCILESHNLGEGKTQHARTDKDLKDFAILPFIGFGYDDPCGKLCAVNPTLFRSPTSFRLIFDPTGHAMLPDFGIDPDLGYKGENLVMILRRACQNRHCPNSDTQM